MIYVYHCPRCPVVTLVKDTADTSMHGHPQFDKLSHRALCPICTLSMHYSGVEEERQSAPAEEPKPKRKYTRRQPLNEEKAPTAEPEPSDGEEGLEVPTE